MAPVAASAVGTGAGDAGGPAADEGGVPVCVCVSSVASAKMIEWMFRRHSPASFAKSR